MPVPAATHETSTIRVVRCGPYRLGRRIGAGGMATVFAARQEGPSGVARLVAVKILSAAVSDDATFQRMFLREARIAARLEHPNIVRVYDVGETGGEIYVAMEFVHGAPLSRLLAGGPAAPIAVGLRIAVDVARGLHAAHELADESGKPLGLVHQDVSPQNILVGYDGSTKLLDFGVAHLGTLDTSRVDGVRGKPAYLSPEQLQSGRIDRRSDVFALGIVLHELLTGERLFQRATAGASLFAVLNEGAPDVRTRRPEVPAVVAEVVARALERDPDARFSSAEALRRALVDAITEHRLEADEAAVGAWLRGAALPSITPSELEREIVDGSADAQAAPIDVADLVTLRPVRKAAEPHERSATPEASRNPRQAEPMRSRWILALGAAVVAALAAAVWLGSGFRRAADPPKPAASASIASNENAASAATFAAPSPTPTPAASQIDPEDKGRASVAAASTASTSLRRPRAASPLPSATSTTAPAPSAATSDATSHIRIGSPNVWGHVYIDGTYVGDSPVPRRAIGPGRHTITIKTDKGDQQQQVVDVAPGDDARVNFSF